MKPGEVYRLFSKVANKEKFHFCVSLNGVFLFLNSPKPRMREGDLEVDGSLLPFLPPTTSGKSIICCTTPVEISEGELRRKGTLVGTAPRQILQAIIRTVEDAEYLSEADREMILGGLDDWA